MFTPLTSSSSLIPYLLALPLLVSAVPPVLPREHLIPRGHEEIRTPYGLAVIPRGATHLALDEETREIVAFKREDLLGRFPLVPGSSGHLRRGTGVSASCTDLSSAEVQQLPGWNTLKTTAQKNWGTGSWNIVTNDKDLPDSPAQNCVSSDAAQVTISGTPDCNTVHDTSNTKLYGTNGTDSVTVQSGYKSSTKTTTTQTSSISVGVSLTATVGIPDIADVSTGFTFDTSFTNTLSISNTVEHDTMITNSQKINTIAGKNCGAEFDVQTCTINGSAKIRMLATGWVWFEYNNQVQGHYKWSLSIDDTLTNQDDRSSFVSVSTSTGMTQNSNFTATCQ